MKVEWGSGRPGEVEWSVLNDGIPIMGGLCAWGQMLEGLAALAMALRGMGKEADARAVESEVARIRVARKGRGAAWVI